jgi:dTDP-4-amino-4,6-dideoxygalactose transaminase
MPPATATDLPLFDLRVEPEDLAAVEAVYRSGRLADGPQVAAFEQEFAAFLGVRHVVAVSSATAALHLSYLAAGVRPGDEVVVPTYTFAATASAVVYCGGTPVFADVLGPHDLSVDPEHVAALIGPRTRAVAVVHFAGYAAPVEELAALCADRGVALVEDAAHAPGATAGGRRLGTFGLAGAFSFFSNKVLPCGEGGALACDDDAVAELARESRGRDDLDCRMDEPRAALLRSRLGRLEADIAARRALVLRYRERLAAVDGVIVPYRDEDVARSSCYVMPVLLAGDDPARRAGVRRALRERHRIQTSLLYPAVHEFEAYRERHRGGPLLRAERAARSEITLPLFPHMTAADVDRVVDALERCA